MQMIVSLLKVKKKKVLCALLFLLPKKENHQFTFAGRLATTKGKILNDLPSRVSY
jgi:hypothetical protein